MSDGANRILEFTARSRAPGARVSASPAEYGSSVDMDLASRPTSSWAT